MAGTVGTLAVDFATGIRAAADHLVALGHQRLAHISGPLHLRTARLRRDCFLNALAGHGIDPSQVLILEGSLRLDGGRQCLQQLLLEADRPTAIFAANELTALGVMWATCEHGLRVPEDLSVVGLDDILLASETAPFLTTVALPRYEIGTLAMRMLLELIALAPPPQTEPVFHDVIGTSLLIRSSTGPATDPTSERR